jgi:hypothetical protein
VFLQVFSWKVKSRALLVYPEAFLAILVEVTDPVKKN